MGDTEPCPESRRLRVLLHGEDYSDAYEELLPEKVSICPHPSPTNLCRACDIKRRAEWHRQQGTADETYRPEP